METLGNVEEAHAAFLKSYPHLSASLARLVAAGETKDEIMGRVRRHTQAGVKIAAIEAEVDYLLSRNVC